MTDVTTAINYSTFGNFLLAMAFENNIRGSLTAADKLMQNGGAQSKTTAAMILFCNIVSMGTIATFACLRPFNPMNCVFLGELTNIFFHIYLVSFCEYTSVFYSTPAELNTHVLSAAFLLFKTWIITSKNVWFLGLSIILILLRTAFALFDLRVSYYQVVAGTTTCTLTSDTTSPIAYVSADILADVICTIAACIMAYTHQTNVNLRNVFAIFATENVLRSGFMLADNLLNLYLYTVGSMNPAIYFCYGLQMYVTAQALNSEFIWVGARTRAVVDAMARMDDGSRKGGRRDVEERMPTVGSTESGSGSSSYTVDGQMTSQNSGFRVMKIYNH
ncbi:hypothetical protein HDU81_008082 [Chytriomyces hyalinus]|nr:hypothetical protein HDU81_008082 [Chytriomyces hyalinus]